MTALPASTTRSTGRVAIGTHLRDWRQRRRMSQLELAEEASVSSRHLSYLETGRAEPSREMVLRLAERLHVPLRERNVMLISAGFAPLYRERPLDDAGLAAAKHAVDLVLRGHEPYPALAVDRHWSMLASNRVVPRLLEGVSADLLEGSVNVLRLSLHPLGLAPRIANLSAWRHHLLGRVRQQIAVTGDPVLSALLDELRAYPVEGAEVGDEVQGGPPELVVPLLLQTEAGLLSLISTTTVFGSAVDVTLEELAMESFFPADERTAEILRGWRIEG